MFDFLYLVPREDFLSLSSSMRDVYVCDTRCRNKKYFMVLLVQVISDGALALEWKSGVLGLTTHPIPGLGRWVGGMALHVCRIGRA